MCNVEMTGAVLAAALGGLAIGVAGTGFFVGFLACFLNQWTGTRGKWWRT